MSRGSVTHGTLEHPGVLSATFMVNHRMTNNDISNLITQNILKAWSQDHQQSASALPGNGQKGQISGFILDLLNEKLWKQHCEF